jgi:8-oxo-dGTP pyrophosphatase MutT (NUDIX family)
VKLCPGKSVGAIVKNRRGEILVLYRKKPPPGLALVAGHIDPADGNPKAAIIRELREETGLLAKECRLVLNAVLPNPCSRGFDAHLWWVYEIEVYGDDPHPERKEEDKHQFVNFQPPDNIFRYILRKDVDPAWLMIFAKLALKS